MLKQFFFILLILICSLPLHAASFDCAKASSLVEITICSDSEISDLDDSLSSSYRKALGSSDKANEIKASQLRWLKERNLCNNKACLKQAYVQRIKELNTLSQSTSRRSDNAHLPKKVGNCTDSSIISKSTRFEGATPGESGGEILISLENGISLYIISVSDIPPSIDQDKYMYSTSDFVKGDKVKLCLTSLPTNCPPGDDRGKTYSVKNYRNKKTFTGVDSWHQCGGA